MLQLSLATDNRREQSHDALVVVVTDMIVSQNWARIILVSNVVANNYANNT